MKTMLVMCAALVAVACKSKSNPQPDFVDAAKHADAKVDVDAPIDAAPECYLDAGVAGCFQCTPTTDEDFLNACTDGTCVAFDNAARLPLYNGGNLPPLPQ